MGAQRAERGADGDVEVGVVEEVGGYDGCGGAFVGEHADEDEVGVVDPVEGWVGFGGDSRGGEVGLDGGEEGEVGVQGVGFVFFGGDECYGGFGGVGVG